MKLNNGCSTLCAHCHNICFICGSLCFEEYLTGNVIGSSVGKVFILAVWFWDFWDFQHLPWKFQIKNLSWCSCISSPLLLSVCPRGVLWIHRRLCAHHVTWPSGPDSELSVSNDADPTISCLSARRRVGRHTYDRRSIQTVLPLLPWRAPSSELQLLQRELSHSFLTTRPNKRPTLTLLWGCFTTCYVQMFQNMVFRLIFKCIHCSLYLWGRDWEAFLILHFKSCNANPNFSKTEIKNRETSPN